MATISNALQDSSLQSLFNQGEVAYLGTKSKIDKELPLLRKVVEDIEQFSIKIQTQAKEVFSEDAARDLANSFSQYEKFKSTYEKTNLIIQRTDSTIIFLKPKQRTYLEEKSFQETAPELHAQTEKSEMIALDHINALQPLQEEMTRLNKKLFTCIHAPLLTRSLERLSNLIENFERPYVYNRSEYALIETQKRIDKELPILRNSISDIQEFSSQVRAQGKTLQEATECLESVEQMQLMLKQALQKYETFKSTYKSANLLIENIENTIKLLTPEVTTHLQEPQLQYAELNDLIKNDQDTCLAHIDRLQLIKKEIAELNEKLLELINYKTLLWSLQRFSNIVANEGKPLSASTRLINYFTPYVVTICVPNADEIPAPLPTATAPHEPPFDTIPIQLSQELSETDILMQALLDSNREVDELPPPSAFSNFFGWFGKSS